MPFEYTQPGKTWEGPKTWQELSDLIQDLASKPDSVRRAAIQAHPGKAAAVTVFEWVKSMGGNPMRLDDLGARKAFTLLWKLAPSLAPESTEIQFDTANRMLVNDKISLVHNWTYGIKVVRENPGKTHIKVAEAWPKNSKFVLGGDVLAIPKNARDPELAIKLIKQLVAKDTQRALATKLFWAPVREDVYTEIATQKDFQEPSVIRKVLAFATPLLWHPSREDVSAKIAAQEHFKEFQKHFAVIRKALNDAELRPATPEWLLVEDVLSKALGHVLEKGSAKNAPDLEKNPDELSLLLYP